MPTASPSSAAPMTRRRMMCAAVAAGTALAFGGRAPARASGRTALRLSLDWRVEGPSAPFLMAQEKGYFDAEGLDVAIEPGIGSRETVTRVASGGYDVGFGDVTSLIRFRDANPGLDIKAVMMVYDRPPFAIVGRKSRGISQDPKSLEGRKLGAPAADGAFAQWPIFKALTHIDDSRIRFENVGFPVREPMLASGELDAIFGFAHSTLISVKARGVPVDDIVTLLMSDYGLALYGNAIMASPKLIADNPTALRGLLRALVRGVCDTLANPEAAVQLVAGRNESLSPPVELERLRMVIEQNIATPWVRENGLGDIDPQRWEAALGQIALAFGFKDRARAGDAFTSAFLPQLGERRI